jgi:hypothetical protein
LGERLHWRLWLTASDFTDNSGWRRAAGGGRLHWRFAAGGLTSDLRLAAGGLTSDLRLAT